MIPIARLALELRVTGIGQIVIGVAGLVGALLRDDVALGRALVPFAVAVLMVGAVSVYATRWLRSTAAAPSGGAREEPASQTVRRSLVGMSAALLTTVAAVAIGGGLGAVIGGVVAAVGAVDLRNLAWVRARERASGEAIFRALGSSPFAGGRRPLYTRPMNESTLAT